jgi:hypothetical protein
VIDKLNFHQWWIEYAQNTDLEIGGLVWLAAYAAWSYREVLAKQEETHDSRTVK